MCGCCCSQLQYYIRERRVAADPREAVDFEALGLPEARPPLGPDPTRWLEPGAWTGTTEQIRWEPGAGAALLHACVRLCVSAVCSVSFSQRAEVGSRGPGTGVLGRRACSDDSVNRLQC